MMKQLSNLPHRLTVRIKPGINGLQSTRLLAALFFCRRQSLYHLFKEYVESEFFHISCPNVMPRSDIQYLSILLQPIIDAPKSKPVLPFAAQTRNSKDLKICTCIILKLTDDQKIFSQPSQYCNFLYQGGEIHGFYASFSNAPNYQTMDLNFHDQSYPCFPYISQSRQLNSN